MKKSKRITPFEWVNIGLGALLGFSVAYIGTGSLIASIMAGVPSGMLGGIISALIWPHQLTEAIMASSPKIYASTPIMLILLAFNAVLIFVFTESHVDKYFTIALCFAILVNVLIFHMIRSDKSTKPKEKIGSSSSEESDTAFKNKDIGR